MLRQTTHSIRVRLNLWLVLHQTYSATAMCSATKSMTDFYISINVQLFLLCFRQGLLPPNPEWVFSSSNCTFCGFTVGVLTTNGFIGWDSLDLSACYDKHNRSIHKTKASFYITERAIKAQERKKRERKRERYPEENLPRALGSWSSGFWVWRSWTRWSDGRGVPFAAWETGGRWEQQRVRQRQGEEEGADGGMLKGT